MNTGTFKYQFGSNIYLHVIPTVVIVAVFLLSCSREITLPQLEERTGLYYRIHTDVPYTGPTITKKEHKTWKLIYGFVREDLTGYLFPRLQKTYEDGKLIDMTQWDKKGKIIRHERYDKNSGKPYTGDIVTLAYTNGQKHMEVSYIDGRQINITKWDVSENEIYRERYDKDTGEPYNGSDVETYTNGQKHIESIWKEGKLDGTRTFWYENGQKEIEEHWKDGIINGTKTHWSENGQKFFEETYQLSFLNGPCTAWYQNGQKNSELIYRNNQIISIVEWDERGSIVTQNIDRSLVVMRNKLCYQVNSTNPYTGIVTKQNCFEYYKNGKPEGRWVILDSNGQKREEITYQNGKREGKWIKWYYNGQKELENNFKDGKMDGLFTTWYSNGQKQDEKIFKKNGMWNGTKTSTSWYENGQKRVERKPDGTLFEWYENGQKKVERSFKNHKRDSTTTEWYENGKKKIESTFKNGKAKGLSTTWYKNGQKETENTYKDGKRHGARVIYYENGQKAREDTYKNDEKNGMCISWLENGQKKEEFTYKDGEKDGIQIYWYDNGQKQYEETYKDGEFVDKKEWDEDGNVEK